MNKLLQTNLGEFTIGWFLLSVVLGGALGMLLKHFFDVRLTETFKRIQSEKQLIKKYSYPLLLAANDVELRIENILKNGIQKNWLDIKVVRQIEKNEGFLEDSYEGMGYFYLSTLYLFSRYFAWLEILKHEIGFLETPIKYKRSKFFFDIVHRITNSFRYSGLWESHKNHDCIKLFRHIQSAIGEVMIKKTFNGAECISFQEFVSSYRNNDKKIRFWTKNLSKYFEGLTELNDNNFDNLESVKDYRIFRLIVVQYEFFELIKFLDPKFEKVHKRSKTHGETILNRLPEEYRLITRKIPIN